MNHIQITIKTSTEEQEILITQLLLLDAVGFEQTDTELIAYFEEENFDNDALNNAFQGYTYHKQIITKRNWNEEWEQSFEPVLVEDFCVIRSHFHQPVTGVTHEIIITPKMSFGTGHHATTFLMVQAMRSIDFTNKAVFDFGTGTGILAILASKLGAQKIDAIDVDDWSVANAQENFEKNDVTNVSVSLTSLIPKRKFDIILANINKNVLLQYGSELAETCADNGFILASGLLVNDKDDLVRQWEKEQLTLISSQQKDNWICLLFTKA